MSTIICETNGTDGDILPFIRIGKILKRKGHKVAIVTHGYYESKVKEADLDFIPLDTLVEYAKFINDNASMCVNPQGYITFLKKNDLPRILPAYQKVKEYYEPNNTILLSKAPGFLSTIIAEKLDIPRIVIYLAPGFVMSEEFSIMVYDLLKDDIQKIRAELGLNTPYSWRKLWKSAEKYIGLWPEWFKAEHSFLHEEIEKIGFVVDEKRDEEISDEITALLEKDPILINSSSSSLYISSDFFTSTINACEELQQEAILVGRFKEFLPEKLPPQIHVYDQLPFGTLMPKVKAIIHHGGIGTTAQALASGLPQLLLAGGVDRPDNAMCVKQIGVGEYLLPTDWKTDKVISALKNVLSSVEIKRTCEKVKEMIHLEQPVDVLDEMIHKLLEHDRLFVHEMNETNEMNSESKSAFLVEDVYKKDNRVEELTRQLTQKKLEILLWLSDESMNKKSASNRIERQDRKEDINIFPMSSNQEEFWLLNKAQKDFLGLNISSAYKIDGLLNIDALEKSVNEIMKRHENFHSVFDEREGELVQIIMPFTYQKLPLINLSELDSATKQNELEQILYNKNHEPFHLTTGPLFRMLLLKVDTNQYILWWGLHHMLIDGWGQAIFINELKEFYSSFAFGREVNLPTLEIQSADYSVWQRKRLQGKEMVAKREFWSRKLSNYDPYLTLPTDYERPDILDMNHGGEQMFYIDKDLEMKLKEVSSQCQISMFMCLLAAINLLIYKNTKQQDIAIGSPISSRNRQELENLICDFTNTLVYRTIFDGAVNIRDVLERTKETALEVYQNQELPSQEINKLLHREVNPSYSPLFQIFYVLHEIFPGEDDQFLEGVKTKYYPVEKKLSQFDVSIYMFMNEESGLYGKFEYNKDLYQHETIVNYIDQLKDILRLIAERPSTSLCELMDENQEIAIRR